MAQNDRDVLIRVAVFEHVRRLNEIHGHLAASDLKPGFIFDGERIRLVNPQRGIFRTASSASRIARLLSPREHSNSDEKTVARP
jgi:hypothetical protein